MVSPHARSVREVSECDCSWTGCHNSAAPEKPVHFCLKCTRARDSACAQETLQLMILQKKKETKATSVSAQPFKTCVTASPSLGFSCYKTGQGQVYNSSVKEAVVASHGQKKKQAYQVKKESMLAGAKTHQGEDAQSNSVRAPQRLLLHVSHILERPERTFNHMAETHAQNEENKRGWGGGHRGREGGTGTV